MNEKNERLNKILTNVLKVLVCLIIVAVITLITLNFLFPSESKKKDPLDPGLLVTFSQQVVKEYLKSPSSAKFPYEDGNYNVVYNESDGTFTVSGSVEAKNPMGVLLKSDYVVVGKYDAEKGQYIELSTDIS